MDISAYSQPLVASSQSFRWHKEFTTRQKIDGSSENKPYIELFESNSGTNSNYHCTDDNMMRIFMRESEDLRHRKIIEHFCGRTPFGDLKLGTAENTIHPVALLDDRNDTGVILLPRGQCRPFKGPLTQRELYTELRRKVNHCCFYSKNACEELE
jgi:hypothetical protein